MINPKLKQVQEVGDGATVDDLVKMTTSNTLYCYDDTEELSFSTLAYNMSVLQALESCI